MRLFALVLAMAAALVLAGAAVASKPAKMATGFTGTPVFTSMRSPDGIHRDASLTVTFTHRTTVGLRIQATVVNGPVGPLDDWGTYRGVGSESFTFTITGTDQCWAPLPGDKVFYTVQLTQTRGHQTVVVAELTTETYAVT